MKSLVLKKLTLTPMHSQEGLIPPTNNPQSLTRRGSAPRGKAAVEIAIFLVSISFIMANKSSCECHWMRPINPPPHSHSLARPPLTHTTLSHTHTSSCHASLSTVSVAHVVIHARVVRSTTPTIVCKRRFEDQREPE